MVSNKEHSNSRKLYQQILGYKGKIAIYSEYIDFYRDNLEEKTNKKRTEIVSKYKEILDGFEFHLKSVDEIYALIETKDVKEKADELHLEYRKLREENKRTIEEAKSAKLKAYLLENNLAKDLLSDEELADLDAKFAKELSSTQAELDKELEELGAQLDEQLEAYKKELKEAIKTEKETMSESEAKEKLEATTAARDEELAKFDAKEKAENEKKFEKLKAKMEMKIAALSAKLETASAQLAAINEKELEVSPLENDEILKVQDLCMYFGGLHAVDHLDFSVKEGEIYGLIGPNGAGKTTVFNCITQFYKPTAGDLTFRTKENDVIKLNREEVHNIITLGIARTFQNVEVIPECTVLENMLIAANRQYQSGLFDHLIHSGLLRLEEKVITQRALKVLGFMGLLPYAYHLTMGLPYGILKKIEIARTLMTNPQLIILDEPAAGLNDTETKELAKLIKTIRQEYNCTILLVEHDMGLVMDICDRICAISFGKLLAIGTPKEIQANKQVQEAYLGVSDEEGE